MKILQIVHGFPPESVGGTQAYCEAVGRALASRGHTCFILAGAQETRDAPELVTTDQGSLKVTRFIGTLPDPVHWSPSRRAEAERLILQHLDEIRPDVIHVQHWVRLTSNVVAICKSRRIPTVVTLHDLWAACPRGNRLRSDRVFCTDPVPVAPCVHCVVRKDGETDEEVARELDIRQRLVGEELRLADRVLVPSEAQRTLLMHLLEREGVRLHVLAHGTINCLTPSAPSDGAAAPLRVAYWGPLVWWKGPHLLLEALHRLPDPGRVEGHLFGRSADPDYERHLRELAGGLAVVFHGHYSPADLHREGLHLAVFPSLCHESHSFVLDEAFQIGVPAIVSDRGAPALRLGTAGLTFKTGDAGDLSRQVRKVLEEPGLLEGLRRGTPAMPLVPMEVHVAQLEEVYHHAIEAAEVAHRTVEGRW